MSTLEPLPADAPAIPQESTHRLRVWAFALLEEGELTSGWSRAAEVILIALILANVAAVALETIPAIDARFHRAFDIFERVSVFGYSLEYIVRLWCSVEDPRIAARGPMRGRLSFALRPLMIIDFLAFAPSYFSFIFPVDLRVLRIFRLFRLVKLARYSQALPALLGVLYAERSALFASSILLLSTVFVSGEVMHIVEGQVQPDAFGTLPNAMYWAITTLTTVGYGDVTPHTPLGKGVAGVTMVIGLALFALPVGIIANGFISGLNRRRFAITWSILKQQPLLKGLHVEALGDVLECSTADIIREHGQLIVHGEAATMLFLVVNGSVREDLDDAGFLQPGAVVGPEALRNHANYTRTVTARTATRVIGIGHEDIRRLARKYPLLRERLERAIQDGAVSDTSDPGRRAEILERENDELRRAMSARLLDKLLTPSEGRQVREREAIWDVVERERHPETQISAGQATVVASAIAGCGPHPRVLVFGCGNDSAMWAACNPDGDVLFVEDSGRWRDVIKARHPGLWIEPIAYGGRTVADSLPLSEAELDSYPVPSILRAGRWDVILVDAPAGYKASSPGRSLSIFWAYKIASERTHVFIDDYQRALEKAYGDYFFASRRPWNVVIPRVMRLGEPNRGTMLWSVGASIEEGAVAPTVRAVADANRWAMRRP